MESKYDICGFGSCLIDKIFYIKEDGTYNGTPDLLANGGKCPNQLVAATRAGAKTALLCKVADDEIGKKLVNNLIQNNIDVSHVEYITGLENDNNILQIDEDSDNHIVRRVNELSDSYTVNFIRNNTDVLMGSKIVLTHLKPPKEVLIELIDFCHKNNKFLILTPSHPFKINIEEKENLELIDKISMIVSNETECKQVFNTENIESCVEKYPNKLIVTLGEKGLMYHNGTEVIKLEAIKVSNVVDTIGAGDTFVGNLACYLAHGKSLKEAVNRGRYASSLKIQKKGAQTGMPYKEELDEFILKSEDLK